MPTQKVIEAVCKTCNGGYCTLREYLSHNNQSIAPCGGYCSMGSYDCCQNIEKIHEIGVSDRSLLQVKCAESFKYVESFNRRYDIGWNNAFSIWAEKYGQRFRILFDNLRQRDPDLIFQECMQPGSRLKEESLASVAA